MKKNNFFSVVIPTHNRRLSLTKALNSVLKQTYSNFEVIIIDNGSSDGTSELILDYKDKRINYHYQTGSGSPASPRNKGIELSSGDWICFLDSDDFWHSNKLEIVNEYILQHIGIDVFFHYEDLYHNSSKKLQPLKKRKYKYIDYHDLLFNGNLLSPSATVISSSFVKEKKIHFNENDSYKTVEDYDFWLQLAINKANFYCIEKTLGVYVIDGNNLISNWRQHLKNLEMLFVSHINSLELSKERKEKFLIKKRVKINFMRIKYAFSNNDFSDFFNSIFLIFVLIIRLVIRKW